MQFIQLIDRLIRREPKDAADFSGAPDKPRWKMPRWLDWILSRIRGFFAEVYRMISGSLFSKYLFFTSLITISCLILLGFMMATLIANRWQDEKQQQLANNARIVADSMSAYIVPVPVRDSDDKMDVTMEYHITDAGKERLRSTLGILSSSCSADIFIVDAGGNTVICSEEYLHGAQESGEAFKCRHTQSLISPSVISSAAQVPEYRITDKLGGIYDQNHFIVAVPFVAGGDAGKEYIAGFVFVASSAATISDFRSEVFRIVIIAVMVAAIISFNLVYMLTYKQVKPLRDMENAVGRFAEGDFSKRVPVTSHNEVGRLAEAINNMADKLVISDNANRSFIANVSHELKTPMTSISGFIGGILDGTIPYEKQNQYLLVVQSEVKRLSRLVRSMLNLSRIDSGAMELQKQNFNLSSVIFEAMLAFEYNIEEKHIEIQGMEDLPAITVNGDANLIHQVVYNLIDNAVKFTNEGGYIRVNASVHGGVATVSLSNSGIGVPSEDISHIFERFYKTDRSRSLDKHGVGLGLYIVQTVIRLHGGTIRAESTEGDFFRVTFTLPDAVEGYRNGERGTR